KQRATLMCDYFGNGDGVMVVPVTATDADGQQRPSGWHYMRMLLTDSGHYLLPVDDQRQVSNHTRSEISKQMFTWSSEISQKWNDVRHCFLVQENKPGDKDTCRERERCEPENKETDEPGRTTDSNPLETTTSTTSVAGSPASTTTSGGSSPSTTTATSATTVDEAMPTSVRAADSSFTTGSNPKTTTSTTSGVFIDVADTRSGPLNAGVSGDISPTALPCKPFLDSPTSTRHGPDIDSWSVEDGFLVRHHKVPRRVLFTPQCAEQCPVDHGVIYKERTTYMKYVPRKHGETVIQDDWRHAKVPNRDMEQLWTGRTVFKIAKQTGAETATSLATSSFGLKEEDFPHYEGDAWPSHWSEARKEAMQVKHKGIPEEYYTKTGRKPITPGNLRPWLAASSKQGLRWQFWEMCSGSGRLSLFLLTASVMTGFPVDYRYGWDLAHPEHQNLLDLCYQEFQPAHVFCAPTCTPWSNASAAKDRELRAQERQQELPTLEFLHEILLQQHNQNRGFSLEQPWSSARLIDSPIARLRDVAGVRVWRTDQCMLGARDEKNSPIRKTTGILSNRRWSKVIKRCDNHRGQPHGVLQGQVRGVNRTTLAAVYPKRLCQLYGQDLWSVLRKDMAMTYKPWPRQLLWTHSLYYSCERCQMGRAAPPGVEHNMIPGQCRYGQPGMRRARAAAPVPEIPQAQPAAAAPTLPPPTTTGAPSDTSSPIEEAAKVLASPQRSDLEDATGPFKFLARSGDYSMIALECDRSVPLDMEQRLFLKAALMQMLRTCIDIFNKHTSVDYDHWLEDPILLQIFQEVFQRHMSVLGVMCSLRPWHRKVPDPYLSSACAPLRLLVSGNMKRWQVHAVEDMRLMSHGQLHAEVDEADWHFHFFGVKDGDPGADLPDLGNPDGPRGSSSKESDFNFLRNLVEQLSPYKAVTVGWVVEQQKEATVWRKALSTRAVGGAVMGQGLRTVHVPRSSVGVLLFWNTDDPKLHCYEHNNDNPIIMKRVTAVKTDKVLPSEGYDDEPMNSENGLGGTMITGDMTPSRSDVSMSPTSPTTSTSDQTMPDAGSDVEHSGKRKGPDSRTVVLAPETKRSKIEELLSLVGSNQVHTISQHNLINLYWVMHWTQAVPLEYLAIWQSFENSVYIAQWDDYMSRLGNSRLGNCSTVEDATPRHDYLFVWPGKVNRELYADLQHGGVLQRGRPQAHYASIPRLPSVDEGHFDMTDKELIKEVATLAAASYMAAEKTRFVWTALIMSTMLPTATATSTTTATSTSSTAWDDMTWLFTMVIGVIIAERLLMQSFRLWWRHLFGTTTSASTTSTPVDMDVDNSDDQMDVDEACIADTAPVPDTTELNGIKAELEYY
ncbi:unnamed protein product, partial [Symbiodinium necroappetens]